MIKIYKYVEGIEKMDVNECVISSQSSFGHNQKLNKKGSTKMFKSTVSLMQRLINGTHYRKKFSGSKVFIFLKEKYDRLMSKDGTK